MRRSMLAAATFALLGVSACNKNDEPDVVVETVPAGGTPANPATVAEAEAPPATTAGGFATRAALSDLYEIESSRLALERSQSAPIKAYAQRMIDEHSRMSNEMKAAIAQAGLQAVPPTVLDTERTELMRELQSASAGDFDEKYLEQQAEAHENALNLFRDFGNNGDNDLLKQLAARGAPMIENHLQTVRALEKGRTGAATGATAPASAKTN
jgi:putative membrane protein